MHMEGECVRIQHTSIHYSRFMLAASPSLHDCMYVTAFLRKARGVDGAQISQGRRRAKLGEPLKVRPINLMQHLEQLAVVMLRVYWALRLLLGDVDIDHSARRPRRLHERARRYADADLDGLPKRLDILEGTDGIVMEHPQVAHARHRC